jgi:DNA-binding transcriptional LysR family regulator
MSISTPADLAVFVRAVEAGGFSAAARTLTLTPSAVSKIVTRLEDRLGVRLLNRTTRSLDLTPEGQAFFMRAQRIQADIEEAEGELTRTRSAPRGLLRVQASVAFALHQLTPKLPEFAARYPEIEVLLSVSDRPADLLEEGIDLSLRIGRLPDSSMVARRICDIERVICAAPSYLERHGTPRRPEDLLQHNCLRLFNQPALAHWSFNDPAAPGGFRTLEVFGRFSANNAESMRQMAMLGMGIVRLSDLTVGEALQSGALVPILTEFNHDEPVPLQAVMPPGKHRLPKVTAMLDFMIEHFASAPWRAARKKPARRPRAAPAQSAASHTKAARATAEPPPRRATTRRVR